MEWVVDGMNVIGSRPDGWWRDRPGAMRRLVGRLRDHAAASGETITVVFDGRPVPLDSADERVRVVFASRSGPDAADDEIVERLGAGGRASLVAVVTSDAELARRVQALGATVVFSGSFLRRLEGGRTGA